MDIDILLFVIALNTCLILGKLSKIVKHLEKPSDISGTNCKLNDENKNLHNDDFWKRYKNPPHYVNQNDKN